MKQVNSFKLEHRVRLSQVKVMHEARAELRGSMRTFSGYVQQGVVKDLRELGFTTVRFVNYRNPSSNNRMQGGGYGSGLPVTAAGVGGVPDVGVDHGMQTDAGSFEVDGVQGIVGDGSDPGKRSLVKRSSRRSTSSVRSRSGVR